MKLLYRRRWFLLPDKKHEFVAMDFSAGWEHSESRLFRFHSRRTWRINHRYTLHYTNKGNWILHTKGSVNESLTIQHNINIAWVRPCILTLFEILDETVTYDIVTRIESKLISLGLYGEVRSV